VFEHALGILVKNFAGLAGDHAVVAAMKQLYPEVCFQCGHLLAKCRLCDVHLAGRLGETATVNNSDEVFDLTNFHTQLPAGLAGIW
jgi:hypothetical protein